VIGLSPAITEMLFELLNDSQIIAIPPQANFPENGIQNKTLVEVYPLDFEKILSLKPDLVFTEEGITNPMDVNHLMELGINVVVFKYSKTSDIVDAMDSISKLVTHKDNANEKINALRSELEKQQIKSDSIGHHNRPKVLSITWIDPIFAYGFETWMSDKIWLAGGVNCLNEKLDKPYPIIQRESILQLNPDVLLGGTFTKMDTSFFRLYPELKKINAYKTRRIFELNDDLASRPGPRFMLGIKEIEQYLHSNL
jgi:iron complex transport system substrate-binding protein